MVQERDGKGLRNLKRNDEEKKLLGGRKYRREGKIERKN
jgi:hypothetical protein